MQSKSTEKILSHGNQIMSHFIRYANDNLGRYRDKLKFSPMRRVHSFLHVKKLTLAVVKNLVNF